MFRKLILSKWYQTPDINCRSSANLVERRIHPELYIGLNNESESTKIGLDGPKRRDHRIVIKVLDYTCLFAKSTCYAYPRRRRSGQLMGHVSGLLLGLCHQRLTASHAINSHIVPIRWSQKPKHKSFSAFYTSL
jgi:hypothetical protein